MKNSQLVTGKCVIGIVGLGVMGQNLMLNMADHGISVAGYDQDSSKIQRLQKIIAGHSIQVTADLKIFMELLQSPRAILLLVPAGAAVDAVINQLLPYLRPNDLIMDAGNSYFKDTDVRLQQCKKNHIHFLGVGISGGEDGARHGPSIMPGGAQEAYQRVRPIFEAIAAKADDMPCVSYLGEGSAGHFIKMVHNGIEYAMMQLIAEVYDIMKRGLHLNNAEMQAIFAKWNAGELKSYLLEITSHIFNKREETGTSTLDTILGVVKQKGTGMWTSQSARELQVPIPTIDLAVTLRDFSALIKEREQAAALYQYSVRELIVQDRDHFLTALSQALLTSMIIVYAQGMALISVASERYHYHIHLEDVARVWRNGCIIRSKLLDDIYAAFHAQHNLPNLLLDTHLAKKVMTLSGSLREVICQSVTAGLPVAALMASLSYLDTYRSAWLPANLIQAQRDYFGAHTYQRIDAQGIFHTDWKENIP